MFSTEFRLIRQPSMSWCWIRRGNKGKQTCIPADNSSTSQETICPDTTTRKEQPTLEENVQHRCKVYHFKKLPLLQVTSWQWSGFHLCFKSSRLRFCINAFIFRTCSNFSANRRKIQTNCDSVASVFQPFGSVVGWTICFQCSLQLVFQTACARLAKRFSLILFSQTLNLKPLL